MVSSMVENVRRRAGHLQTHIEPFRSFPARHADARSGLSFRDVDRAATPILRASSRRHY